MEDAHSLAHLSLSVDRRVVHQVGDRITWHFTITNISTDPIKGPIDIYTSGQPEKLVTVETMVPGATYDIVVDYLVTASDIIKMFIVYTVWARIPSGCLLGNVAEAAVVVAPIDRLNDVLTIANQKITSIPADGVRLQQSVITVRLDLINLTGKDVDVFRLDLRVLYGNNPQITILVDDQPTDLFDNEDGVIILRPQKIVHRGSPIALMIIGTVNGNNIVQSDNQIPITFYWRPLGGSTDKGSLNFFAETVTAKDLCFGYCNADGISPEQCLEICSHPSEAAFSYCIAGCREGGSSTEVCVAVCHSLLPPS